MLSTKKGPGHGFGLRNVKRVIERYDGTLNINTNDNLFTVTWMIPKRENAQLSLENAQLSFTN